MLDNLRRRVKSTLDHVRQSPLLSRAVSGSFVTLAGSGVMPGFSDVANVLSDPKTTPAALIATAR